MITLFISTVHRYSFTFQIFQYISDKLSLYQQPKTRQNIDFYLRISALIRREKNKNKTYYILQNNLFQNTLSSYKRFILFLHCFTCLFRHVSTWLRSLESINEKELLSSNKFHRYHFSRIVI